MSDLAISEFAADGSTGPSRMVKKGRVETDAATKSKTVLDVEADLNEINNLAGAPEAGEIQTELIAILMDGWDPDQLYDGNPRLAEAASCGTGSPVEPTYPPRCGWMTMSAISDNAGAAEANLQNMDKISELLMLTPQVNE